MGHAERVERHNRTVAIYGWCDGSCGLPRTMPGHEQPQPAPESSALEAFRIGLEQSRQIEADQHRPVPTFRVHRRPPR